MEPFTIRKATADDLKDILQIYNSNPDFLKHHLAKNRVDASFLTEEMSSMKEAGFCSCILSDSAAERAIGVLDYKESPVVYLSLLMLDASLQGRGIGRQFWSFFEKMMKNKGYHTIRIDVVDDYEDNVKPFWESLGFCGCERISLTWGDKRSSALVMKKDIRGENQNGKNQKFSSPEREA